MKHDKFTASLRIGTALLAVSTAFGLTNVASAQQVADVDNDDLIIVTAQGRSQDVLDVPVTVSVVSGEALNDFNVTNLMDAQSRLPAVDIADAPSPQINIRGVGSGNNWGFQQSVGTFVDGIYRGRAVSVRGAFFDLERLEVLKGPQTTFFGANSIAGALNLTTRKPGYDFAVNASALYGSHGEYNFEGGVDVPLGDTLAVRLAGRVEGMGGYISTPTGDAPERDAYQLRGSVLFEPTSTITSELRVDYADSQTVGAQAFELVGCPPNVPNPIIGGTCQDFLDQNGGVVDDQLDLNSDTPLDFADFSFVEAAWTNTINVGEDHSLIFKTGYYDHDSNQQFTGIPFPITGGVPGTTDGLPVRVGEDFEQFSQEVRFQSDEGGFIDYMVGAYYDETKLNFQNEVGFFFADFGALTQLVAAGIIPTSPLPTPVLTNEAMAGDHVSALLTNLQKSKNISAFGAVTLRPTDGLRVNLGGRWSQIRKFATRASSRGVSDNLAEGTYVPYNEDTQLLLNTLLLGDTQDFGGGSTPGRRTDRDFMPSASVQYDLTPDLMLYGSYAEGFKAGGFSTANDSTTFDPEYVQAFEAGLKGTALNGDLTFGLSVFRNNFDNLQETVVQSLLVDIGGGNTVSTINSIVDNVASSRAEGVELELTLDATDFLSFSSSVAYLDARYLDYADAPCSQYQLAAQALDGSGALVFDGDGAPVSLCAQMGGSQDLSGQTRAYAPKWSGNVAANVNFPLTDTLEASFSPVLYFKTDHFLSAEADPLLAQDGYFKVDARFAITSDAGWEAAVIGRNLTDKLTGSFASAVTGANGSTRYLPERPRSFAVQFSLTY